MKMKLKISKTKLIIILIVVILIIVLAILASRPSNVDTAQEELNYIYNDEEWKDETLYPENSAPLKRAYKGELSIRSAGKSMDYVAKEILPMYYAKLKNASRNTITKYYEKEAEAIYMNLLVENQNEFISIIERLQELTGDTITWESYRIDRNTIKTAEDYTKAVLYIKYKGNEEITFNIKFNNSQTKDASPVKYTIKK